MFYYKLGFIPTNFVVVGCGGTGGRLVPLLAQFLKTVNWIQNPRIFLIDHDVVEEKNLIRQNFIRPDINRPKAIVLAERYSKAFDVTIIPVQRKLEGPELVLSEVTHADHGVVRTSTASLNNAFIILCVDSAAARRQILNNFFSRNGQRNLLFIDAGNEDDFGQVQIFSPQYCVSTWAPETVKGLAIPGLGVPFNVDLPSIPFPTKFYESMEDAPTKSCAELDQTLAINALMATTMMGMIQNLIYQKPISYSRLDISLKAGSIPSMINAEYLYEQAMYYNNHKGLVRLPPDAFDLNRIFALMEDKLFREFRHIVNPKKEAAKKKTKKADEKETPEVT